MIMELMEDTHDKYKGQKNQENARLSRFLAQILPWNIILVWLDSAAAWRGENATPSHPMLNSTCAVWTHPGP